jgi:hypothetical protein
MFVFRHRIRVARSVTLFLTKKNILYLAELKANITVSNLLGIYGSGDFDLQRQHDRSTRSMERVCEIVFILSIHRRLRYILLLITTGIDLDCAAPT